MSYKSLMDSYKSFMSQFKDNVVFQNSILSFLLHIGLNVVGSFALLAGSNFSPASHVVSIIFLVFVLVIGVFFYQLIGEVLIPATTKKEAFLSLLTVPLVNLVVWLYCFFAAGGFGTPLAGQNAQIWASFASVNPVLMTGSALIMVPLPIYAMIVLLIEPILIWMGMNRKDKMPVPERFLQKRQQEALAEEKMSKKKMKKNNRKM